MFLEFQIVFDDAVVDNGNTAVFADMGVGIDVVGFPVSGPTGMADAQVALQVRTAVDQVAEDLQTALGLFDLQPLGLRNTCGIVAPVFHPGKAIQQNRGRRLPADETDDSTHKKYPPDSR